MYEEASVKQALTDNGVEDATIEKMREGEWLSWKSLQALKEFSVQEIGRELGMPTGRVANLELREKISHVLLNHSTSVVDPSTFSLPPPTGDNIPWPGLDEKHLSFVFISLLINDLATLLRTFLVYLWNKKYPGSPWDDSDATQFRIQVDRFLYGVDDGFTLNLSHGSAVTLRGKVLECSQGFSEQGVYGCTLKKGLGFRGCRILVNGEFHRIQKVSKDKKKIHLETSPTIDALGQYTIVGRNADMYNANTGPRSALDKTALLTAKSINDWDITALFWMIYNSGHTLLSTNQLKTTLPVARDARNKYSGHVASTKLTYTNFYDAVRSLMNMLIEIEKMFVD